MRIIDKSTQADLRLKNNLPQAKTRFPSVPLDDDEDRFIATSASDRYPPPVLQTQLAQFEKYFSGHVAEVAAREAFHALHKMGVDTVLGSSNRQIHRERTDGWVNTSDTKSAGCMINGTRFMTRLSWIKDPERELPTDVGAKWLPAYELCEGLVNIDTLSDENRAKLAELQKQLPVMFLFYRALMAFSDRAGNCGDKSLLLAYHLVKNGSPAIKRIELMEFSDADHAFLVLNRSEHSDLKNLSTWGEQSFIVDSWLDDKNELRIYPMSAASENLERVREIIYSETTTQVSTSPTNDINWLIYESKAHKLSPSKSSLSRPQLKKLKMKNLPLSINLDINPEEVRRIMPDMMDFFTAKAAPIFEGQHRGKFAEALSDIKNQGKKASDNVP